MSTEASLYRRHRPRTFDQVVGQRHVVRTLSNAIEQDKVHHAYLFVGSRGTGKTSMAKILAASLNCVNGPTLTPCGECESCRAIAAGTSVDVIEMDAASNRSVDDIRALRDRVAFAPASGHWKVYILDEAHMLTKEAWNAFLKTLEEPPPHTAFILATTEAHKVMPTIADRCQRFDFQRPSVEQLAEVIDRVAVAESIRIDPAAVSMVARAAGGSFRDALGTLDQLVAYTGQEVALDAVLDLLGAADAEVLFGVVDAVIAADPRAVLENLDRVIRSGQDPVRLARELLGHLRVLLVTQATGEVPESSAVTAADPGRTRGQAQALGPANLMRTIDELAAALAAVRQGDEARLALEVALVKASRPEYDPSVEGVVRRLERLESDPRPSSPAQPPAAPRAQVDPQPQAAAASPADAPREAPGPSAPIEPDSPGPPPASSPPPVSSSSPAPSTPPEPAVTLPSAPAPVADAPADPLDLERLTRSWPAVLDSLQAIAPGPVASYFEGTRPTGSGDAKIEVGFPADAAFNRRNAEKPERRQKLAEAVRQAIGVDVELVFTTLDGGETPEPGSQEPRLTEEELVARVKSEFNAEEVI